MRELTDHVVVGDSVNHQLQIEVVDEPGSGGANHEYLVSFPPINTKANETAQNAFRIKFQNGPIKEYGVNGLTHEALLAVVIDRLRAFQAGPYSCRENAIALTSCEEALMWLQRRTVERIRRGVEGTVIK